MYEEGHFSQEKYFKLLECRPEINQVMSMLEMVTKDDEVCRKFIHVLQQVKDYYCPELQNWMRNTFPVYFKQTPGSIEKEKPEKKSTWSRIKRSLSSKHTFKLEQLDTQRNPLIIFCQLKESLRYHKHSITFQKKKIQGNLDASRSCCELIEIKYTELLITNEDPVELPDQHEYFILANRRARIYAHNKHQKITLGDLLTPMASESKTPRRVLVTGIAGIGKSLAMQRLIHDWAIGMVYRDIACAVHFALRELNLARGPVSFIDLVKRNHVHLDDVVEKLCLDPRNLMIILDGLDEFQYSINEGKAVKSISDAVPIKDLVFSLIKGYLLPGASVMVTSRPRPSVPLDAFDRRVVILGFEQEQVREYCFRFFRDKELSEDVFQYIIQNENLSGMSFIPLYCFIICTALSSFFQCRENGSCTEKPPQTITEVYRSYLCTIMHHHMRQSSSRDNETDSEPIVLCSPPIYTAMKDVLYQLGKLAYYSLLENKILFYPEDIQKYGFHPTELPDSFLQRIFVPESGQQREVFAFFHLTLQEHLAALYCVMSLTPMAEELTQCLDLWCFGVIPEDPVQCELLSTTLEIQTDNQWERLQMFSRFFMGLLCYRIEGKLKGLVECLSCDILDPLTIWFKGKIRYEVNQKLLNLLHCLRELQQETVVRNVASEIDEVNFFKVTLNPADCATLCYVLQHCNTSLKILNIGYANIGIQGLRILQLLLHRCQTLYLRYNSLTKEAAMIVSKVLKSDCEVRSLLMCGNSIGSEGVRYLWDALSSNDTLEELYVDITGITDNGLDNFVSCLTHNSTLRLLTIAGNNLTESGKHLLVELQEFRQDLKILRSFAGDMGLLQAYLDWVEDLKKDPQQLESAKNANALRNVLWELEKEEPEVEENNIKARILLLKKEITELLESSSGVVC
ncbi:NACHT, LRR and PYD domains-containing protein 3-like [Xenopus laevis]|nr:NACHT, LRR and PYD domains-containing protein 3-like [Xenopus laevis]